jgi:AmmeMemoRadiSam system protein B
LFPFLFFGIKIYFQPVAIVVPHHNFVAQKRLEYFKTIALKRPFTKKIIIIGPNHFSPNQSRIIYSNRNWQLSNGELYFDKQLESNLIQFANLDNSIVKNDHAIFNLLPDIKTVWPKATVFPILIGQNYDVSKLDNLISNISKVCRHDCLLISSVDFSHYLPADLADVHDQKSIYDLSTQNLEEIPKLEVDSPQSLYVLAKFSQSKNAHNWDLFYHSNSGALVNNYDVETTSHVLGSYQKSFQKDNISELKTYLISKSIDKNKSLNSLGERFFYGTDYINLNYSSKPSFILPFELQDDYVITVIIDNTKSTYKFFPTETKDGATYFLRGNDKKDKAIHPIISPN